MAEQIKKVLHCLEIAEEYLSIDPPRNAFPILKLIPYQGRLRKALKMRDEIFDEIFEEHLKEIK